MMRASSLRLSPLLLMAAALVALAVLFAPGARASSHNVWQATLTVAAIPQSGGAVGCTDFYSQARCEVGEQLSADDEFSLANPYGSRPWMGEIKVILLRPDGELRIVTDQELPEAFKLDVDGQDRMYISTVNVTRGYSQATGRYFVTWANTDLDWEAGDMVKLRLIGHIDTLEELTTKPEVKPKPKRDRTPDGGSPSGGFCYVGRGTEATEIVRNADGSMGEVPRVGSTLRSLFACD